VREGTQDRSPIIWAIETFKTLCGIPSWMRTGSTVGGKTRESRTMKTLASFLFGWVLVLLLMFVVVVLFLLVTMTSAHGRIIVKHAKLNKPPA
jgi:uncharacterized membrane protein